MHRFPCRMLLAVVIAGCTAAPSEDPGPTGGDDHDGGDEPYTYVNPFRDYPTVAAGNGYGSTDARFDGQQQFLWDTWGTEAAGGYPPVAFLLQVLADEPDVFGAQFERFGFLPDPNDDLPIGLKRGRNDPTRVEKTCGLCHTSRLPDGQLWFGMPNTGLDLPGLRIALDERWTAAGNPSTLGSDEYAEEMGPGRVGAQTYATGHAVGVDYPVKLELANRESFNVTGTGKTLRSEVYLSLFATGVGNIDGLEFPADDAISPFIAFFGSFSPPVAPAQDAAQVAAGHAVFDAAGCGGCHHVGDLASDAIVPVDEAGVERRPGEDPDYPNGTIATDTARFALQQGADGEGAGLDPGYASFVNFILEHRLSVITSDGYRPAELRGLWLSAPYLHNGSVPTLADLLQPAAGRPVTWTRGSFTVDTTRPGNGNQGHEFGTDLAAADKEALVTYLLSL